MKKEKLICKTTGVKCIKCNIGCEYRKIFEIEIKEDDIQ